MSKRVIFILAAVLLVVVFVLPFLATRNFSPAFDEITHIPSGYSYIKTGEIKLNPQHPPLIKMLAAIPLLFLDLKFDQNRFEAVPAKISEWEFGENFLFSNDTDKILLWARIPMLFLSVLLGFYIFKWASELFSPPAGLFALFLYTFTPVMIGNAQFVTTDLGVSVFVFITLYYFWKFSRTDRRKHLVFSGIFLGLALGAKFSAVLLVPLILLFALIHIWRLHRNNIFLWQKSKKVIKILAPVYLTGFLVIYLLYFFPSDISFYLKGLNTLYADKNPNYYFFLNGSFSKDGWWYYFLSAFLVKTPAPFLIFLAAAVVFYKKYKMSFLEKSLILATPLIFFTVTSIKAYNIGIRYILPVYPFLILYAGGLINLDFWRSGARKAKVIFATVLLVLSSWLFYSTISVHPDYLAYFNDFVGGSQNGYKYLNDSNIEWGHDLRRLKKYQEQYPETKVIYSWPRPNFDYYGITNRISAQKTKWWINPSGRYALNTNLLTTSGLYSRLYNEPLLDWLNLYQPTDRIGYSFLIFEFK